jgi:hypothetical protein
LRCISTLTLPPTPSLSQSWEREGLFDLTYIPIAW